MTAPKRTPFQIEADRRELTRLYLRGVLQKDIAAQLGVTQQMISLDLKTIRKQWQRDTAFDLDEAKAKELARIDELERTYWEAFERSKATKERRRSGRRESGDWAEIDTEDMVGNPAFLAGVLSCIAKRCELLGLDAPTKQEINSRVGHIFRVIYDTEPPALTEGRT